MIVITTRPQSMQTAIGEWQKYDSTIRPVRMPEQGAAVLSLPGGWEKLVTDAPRLIFTRHMFPVGYMGEGERGAAFSVQARGRVSPADIQAHEQALLERGMVKNDKHPEWVMSLYGCETADTVYAGLSRACDNRSRWSGGEAHYKKDGTISRAEFKLLEAIEVFGLRVGDAHGLSPRALDLGAAPGGWTKVLLEAGADVTAVDPGALDARLRDHPCLSYVCATAQRFFEAYNGEPFDLIVNDMKMDMYDSARIMLDAAHLISPAGCAVMTIKLPRGYSLSKINKLLAFLEKKYRVCDTRQLFHNRDEVSVLLSPS